MRFSIENRLERIPPLADEVAAFLEGNGVDAGTCVTVNLCLDELLTNTIVYGYRDQQKHEITVDLELHGGELTIQLEDDAEPFDPTSESPEPDLHAALSDRRIGGLGIHLVRSFTESMVYTRRNQRNRLTLKKRLTPAARS